MPTIATAPPAAPHTGRPGPDALGMSDTGLVITFLACAAIIGWLFKR